MTFTVGVSPAKDAVLVVVEGPVVVAEVESMVNQARALSDRLGLPILYDMSRAEPGDVSKSDLFWMPRNLPALKSPWARRVRVALVHPEEHKENARFWEDSFRNLGLDVRAFTQRDDAERWLR